MGAAKVAGSLSADSWAIAGNAGAITVGRWAKNRSAGGQFVLRATGNVGAVIVGGADHLDLLAGMNGPASSPVVRGDFDATVAALASFTVKGWKVAPTDPVPQYFTSSRIAAAKVGSVTLLNVDPTAGNDSYVCAWTADPVNPTKKEIKLIRVTNQTTPTTKTTFLYPARPPASFAVPGLAVDVL